jgi:hypothetical protein
MAKLEVNSLLTGIRGKIQGLQVRKIGGQNVISPVPDPRESAPTDGEVKGQDRMRLANSYRRGVSPEMRERYLAVARQRGHPLPTVAHQDYLNPPVIEAVDLRGYGGQPGFTIRILAHDDFEIRSLRVVIRHSGGAEVEAGDALHLDGDRWSYVTVASAGITGGVMVEVTARDWPDHPTVHRAACAVRVAAPAEPPTAHALLARRVRELALVPGQFRLSSGATSHGRS